MINDEDDSLTLRMPAARVFFCVFATTLIGVICLGMLAGTTLALINGEVVLGIVGYMCAAVMVILFLYVLRDMRSVWGWQVHLEDDKLDLRLPAGRSLSHHVDRYCGRIPAIQMESIETRLESYGRFLASNMHRSYALRLRSGDAIFLGEDRALGTAYEMSTLGSHVSEIMRHYDLPLHDLGMAEGKAGILQVLFSSPPAQDAPNLDDRSQSKLWRRAVTTGRLSLIMTILVLIAVIIGYAN
ncbi:MAG: hypothetical protein KA739_05575 [Pseudomonadales bacterium]|jgi:hypothetical protein|nr:hypothetical protein [Gammaproteobacteria bacterium]MBP6051298.1 hypothetical protein [Pseudomonadales bacterium]MBK6581644.1 hypothetical protein [Gammaproteobacteria bacterium]MBK7170494.1 hypothetical protein [Gammaproteobacteria bacterium]MBK7522404.1 hypothetical protein [Gammaproteobacteria bacterium]